MPSSTPEFERAIPDLPFRRMLIAVVLVTTAATIGWELRSRALGYAPTLNDTSDLWAQERERVQGDSIVIIGDSRPFFDMDLDQLEAGFGQRPLQLSMPGSCGYPILADLANDPHFAGTVICSIVPRMFFAPGGPLIERSENALKRFRTWTPAQRASHQLGMLVEERLAFLKQRDLTLPALLETLPIPNRSDVRLPGEIPPYFASVDRDRRARMTELCAKPGPLQTKIREGWIARFGPPQPPSYVPKDAFLARMGKIVEARFGKTAEVVAKIRARGGNVVFVRFPLSGKLKELEDRATPRTGIWTRLLKESGAPGVYFEDFPELAGFDCPEWSHLSASDSVEFTKRLVPHLKTALAQAAETNPKPGIVASRN